MLRVGDGSSLHDSGRADMPAPGQSRIWLSPSIDIDGFSREALCAGPQFSFPHCLPWHSVKYCVVVYHTWGMHTVVRKWKQAIEGMIPPANFLFSSWPAYSFPRKTTCRGSWALNNNTIGPWGKGSWIPKYYLAECKGGQELSYQSCHHQLPVDGEEKRETTRGC